MLKRSSSSYTNHLFPSSGGVCAANRIHPVSYLQYSSTFHHPIYQPSSHISKHNSYLRPQTPKVCIPKHSHNSFNSSAKVINEKREDIKRYKKIESPFIKKNNISQLLSSLKKEIIEISDGIKESDCLYKRHFSVGRSRPITPSKGITTQIMNKTHFFENKSAVFGLSRDYSPFENDRTIHTYQYKQKENEEQKEKMNRLIAMNESLERQVITLTQKLNSTNKAIPELIEKNNRLEELNFPVFFIY